MAIQRGTSLGAMDAIAALAGGAVKGMGAYQQERGRRQEEAQTRASGLQKAISAALLGGQGAQAASMLPQYGEAFSEATGADFRPSVAGAALPGGGRDFNNPRTTAAIRALAGIESPRLIEVSPFASLFDPGAGNFVATAPGRTATGLTYEQRLALQDDQQAARMAQMQAQAEQRAANQQAGPGLRPGTQAQAMANDQRALRALEDWRRRREQEPQRLLDAWIKLNTQTYGGLGRNKRTVPPMPTAVQAERERILKEWEARNPSPPTPGGQGKPDPFANP